MDRMKLIQSYDEEATAIGDDCTQEEITQILINKWESTENVFFSKKYEIDDFERFQGFERIWFDDELMTAIDIYFGYSYYKLDRLYTSDTFIEQQLKKYDSVGLLCLYGSVVQACLMYELGFSKDDIKLVQGYYDFKASENLPLAKLFGDRQLGMHAWLELRSAVVDYSIISQRVCIEIPYKEGIIGKVPDHIKLIGTREDFTIIKKYARMLAKQNNQTYYEWINTFKQEFYQVVKRALDENY